MSLKKEEQIAKTAIQQLIKEVKEYLEVSKNEIEASLARMDEEVSACMGSEC